MVVLPAAIFDHPFEHQTAERKKRKNEKNLPFAPFTHFS
jgi:hypothetical protein